MQRNFNYFLFLVVAFLVVFSFFFFACLSAPTSLQGFGNTTYYLFHQIISGLLPGIALGYAAYKISLPFLKKIAPWLLLSNIVLMFLVFVPKIGFSAGGANRWLNLGFGSLQPAELLKITAILYLSAWIASKLPEKSESNWLTSLKQSSHNFIYIFLPFVAFLGLIFIALYLQRDVSTMGIISLTLLVIYFSSKTPLWHTLAIIGSGLAVLLFIVRFEPYRLSRWMVFLNPSADPLGMGYQTNQALISLGSGGVFGKGLGMSAQKFGFLPESLSDSIFAILGEEIGAIGCIGLIAIFILLFWLGLKIAKNSTDRFSKMTAVGISFWIIFQAFINIASTAGIFPLAGIPLPFFSYGGSHLVSELIGIGLLLNISRNT